MNHTSGSRTLSDGGQVALLPWEKRMSTDNDTNRGPSDPNPPDGVKAPGKPHAPVQEGPAQDSEIDDDDSIED